MRRYHWIHCFLLLLCPLRVCAEEPKLDAAQLKKYESALQINPEDGATRARLLAYYAQRTDEASRVSRLRHVAWLIGHHPDSALLFSEAASLRPADFKAPLEGSLGPTLAAWRQQVEANPGDARVLSNAVRGIYQVDNGLTWDCLTQLRKVEPSNPRWAFLLASLYIGAISNADLAPKVLAELEKSKDLPVVGVVGESLYAKGRQAHAEPLAQYGEKLLKKAREMDPMNPRWSTSAAVKPGVLTERDLWPFGAVGAMAVPEGAVRVAPEVQAARAMEQPAPECGANSFSVCPATKTAVKLDALIGTDGRVKSLRALNGDMTSIPAAMDAARFRTYQPAMSDGKPVEVVSQILVVLLPSRTAPAAAAGPKPRTAPAAAPKVVPPVILTKVEPEYTAEAHAVKFSGAVKLSLVVDEQGVPREVKVVRGAGFGLDEKAVEAVRKWTFRPGTRDGKPVAMPAMVDAIFNPR